VAACDANVEGNEQQLPLVAKKGEGVQEAEVEGSAECKLGD